MAESNLKIAFFSGTDGGGIEIVPDGKGGFTVRRIPPWNPEQFAELRKGLEILQAATAFKTPGLTNRIVESVMGHVQKQFGEHFGTGGVMVFGP